MKKKSFFNRWISYVFLILCPSVSIHGVDHVSNPFVIDFTKTEELTHDDYIYIQNELRKKNIGPLIEELYEEAKSIYGRKRADLGYFYVNCSRFMHRTFIDPSTNRFPRVELIQINEGGDNCVVSSAPYEIEYPELLLNQIESLKHTGFNGYFLMFLGAYPNPTGVEISYAGVPSAVKIFAMVEAHKRGFNKVLWLDCAMQAQRDITPIFDEIEKNEFVGHYFDPTESRSKLTLPATRRILEQCTSVDVVNVPHVVASVLGLKMDAPLAQSFIQNFYECVQLGTPFLSCLPEEFVYSAILGQSKYEHWMKTSLAFRQSLPGPLYHRISRNRNVKDSHGYFFDVHKHSLPRDWKNKK